MAAGSSRRARLHEIETHPDSLTGKYLSGRTKIALPRLRTPRDPKRVIKVIGATGNNLKKVDAEFPLGPLHLRDRRFRFGQVHAGERHSATRTPITS